VLLVLTELVLLEAMVATVQHLQFQAHLQRMAVEEAGDFISIVQQELAEQVEAAMAALPDQEAVLQSIPAAVVEAVGKKSIMAETVALASLLSSQANDYIKNIHDSWHQHGC